ncbi:MAG: hypothetical protein N4A35_03545 [Flavobacteriales bacterium]|jgi:hypothetical protein|nr:hypothetical protein [Flavobacteriales bacterium]
MTAYEKIITTLGFLGFFILLPQLLAIFGINDPQLFLEQNLGAIGTASALSIIGLSLILLAVIFGGGETIGATFLGLVIGFLLISTSVEVSFMVWLKKIMALSNITSNFNLNYLVGVSSILLGLLLSYSSKFSFKALFAIIIILPLSFIGISQAFELFQFENKFEITVDKGFSSLASLIDPEYQDMPEVVSYIQTVETDTVLNQKEKEEKMEELQENINKLEEDKATLEQLKKENEKFKALIKQQAKELAAVGWCKSAMDTSSQTKSFQEAVTTDEPCVRDYALTIVKDFPGNFYDTERGLPGKSGMNQICALNLHLFSNWKYISDPTVLRDDFYSRADRTIAIGLAGDCDDFAVLNAACVESIGGIARIMGGQCDGGGHAWCEVLIGTEAHYNTAVTTIRSFYKDPNKKLTPTIDENGLYWLVLDWRIGEYTCNDFGLEQLYPKNKLQLVK